MVRDAPSDAAQAQSLALALDAIEVRLAALPAGAAPSAIAEALAGPVRVFDAAASAALGPGSR